MNFAQIIYKLAERLDRKHIENFDGETAPYCGHHYNGHTGKYTQSSYHESDGEAVATLPLFNGWKLVAVDHTDEGAHWYIEKMICDHTPEGLGIKGNPCRPVYKTWQYHGNIFFRRGFTNQFFSLPGKNSSALHFLGFRFTSWIGTRR